MFKGITTKLCYLFTILSAPNTCRNTPRLSGKLIFSSSISVQWLNLQNYRLSALPVHNVCSFLQCKYPTVSTHPCDVLDLGDGKRQPSILPTWQQVLIYGKAGSLCRLELELKSGLLWTPHRLKALLVTACHILAMKGLNDLLHG